MYSLEASLPRFLILLPDSRLDFSSGIDTINAFLKQRCGCQKINSLDMQDIFLNSSTFNTAVHEAYLTFINTGQHMHIGSFHLGESYNCDTTVYFTMRLKSQADFGKSQTYECTLLGFADKITTSPAYRKTIKKQTSISATSELTTREKEVLSRIANGAAAKEIAKELYISVHTVETHKQKLYRKLNARNIAELGKYAERYGLV